MALSIQQAVFNHVVFPPKLPPCEDANLVEVERRLLLSISESAFSLEAWLADSQAAGQVLLPALALLRRVLNRTSQVHGEAIEQGRLASALAGLAAAPADGLILYVRNQNCGLVIRPGQSRANPNNDATRAGVILLEAFEASPRTTHALGADVLEWDFPDTAAAVRPHQLADPAFRQVLARFLDQASSESLSQFAHKGMKAGATVIETRETVDPALITETLIPVLEAMASPADAPSAADAANTKLRKRVRDDVIWGDAAIPWRRSPFWLVLRVAMQRILSAAAPSQPLIGRAIYKFVTAILLGKVIEGSVGQLAPQSAMMALQKLARRMAKLETDRAAARGSVRLAYETLFAAAGPRIGRMLVAVKGAIAKIWESHRKKTQRVVPSLPRYAPVNETRLTLPNSRAHLLRILSEQKPTPSHSAPVITIPSDLKETGARALALKLREASSAEEVVLLWRGHLQTTQIGEDTVRSHAAIGRLGQEIGKYLDLVLEMYHAQAENMSLCILTTLVLWMTMDEFALEACPSLARYNPIFQPAALDFLQLPTIGQMARLRKIQDYLATRWANADLAELSIFSDPVKDCFAQMYIADSWDPESDKLRRLWDKIAAASGRARAVKQTEWAALSATYDKYTQAIHDNTCACGVNPDGSRDIRGCIGCYNRRQRKRLRISIHEDYLPKCVRDPYRPDPATSAIVLELGMPRFLIDYRAATWKILITLARPPPISVDGAGRGGDGKKKKRDSANTLAGLREPALQLRQFTLLDAYHSAKSSTSYPTLASWEKSYSQTHYGRELAMKQDLNNVLKPFGAAFRYWAADSPASPAAVAEYPTFLHLCGLWIPEKMKLGGPRLDGRQWPGRESETPSSYEAVARQTRCPSHMAIHEHVVLHGLLGAGPSRRWPSILRELGASNLNYSSEDTVAVLIQLAIQAGPGYNHAVDDDDDDDDCDDEDGDGGGLGDHHDPDTIGPSIHNIDGRQMGWVFGDRSFREQLIAQLDRRLDAIASSWREHRYMELLITLILRMRALAGSKYRAHHSIRLLIEKARKVTWDWIILLRREARHITDAATMAKLDELAMAASLLCRRTFQPYEEAKTSGSARTPQLDSVALGIYVEASIGLEEHFRADLAQLSPSMRQMLVRDIKLAHRLRDLVRYSIFEQPEVLEEAIAKTWEDPAAVRQYDDDWAESSNSPGWLENRTLPSKDTVSHAVHYNYLDGRLHVDGKPLGHLPVEFTRSDAVKDLFGERHLRVFPSSLPGMTYELGAAMGGNEWGNGAWKVHFGFRGGDNRVFIRAVGAGMRSDPRGGGRGTTSMVVTEYVPPQVFKGPVDSTGSPVNPDLPHPLIKKCAHWLVLGTKTLEIRREPHVWSTRPGNWIIDVAAMRATRRGKSTLVDRSSWTFRRIAAIFQDFVDPVHLVVYQPNRGRLTVEIKLLELSFFVNNNRQLESKQLGAVIDFDQDAGTMYGLSSMIVLRDACNPAGTRSFITPLGPVEVRAHGFHVQVRVRNIGMYGRFGIDTVLGRVTCAPETRLLYSKAQFHAFTSFVLPDPLTGRTGQEEALHFLRSGLCQPWTPFADIQRTELRQIASLSPARTYYPAHLKCMQQVQWNPALPECMQHDSYRPAVQAILDRASRLATFYQAVPGADSENGTETKTPENERLAEPAPDLRARAEVHRRRFEPPGSGREDQPMPKPVPYPTRYKTGTKSRGAVRRSLDALALDVPFCLDPKTKPLHQLMAAWPDMAPPASSSNLRDVAAIGSLLREEVGARWWSYVALLCGHDERGPLDQFEVALMLAVLSHRADRDLISYLAAFARMPGLNALKLPPIHVAYPYRHDDQPKIEVLEAKIRDSYVAFTEHRSYLEISSIQRASWTKKEEHDDKCRKEGERLAQFILAQWPCSDGPYLGGVVSDRIRMDDGNLAEALEPEWRRAQQNYGIQIYLAEIDLKMQTVRGKSLLPAQGEAAARSECLLYQSRDRASDRVELRALLLNKGPPLLARAVSVPSDHSAPALAPTGPRQQQQQHRQPPTIALQREADQLETLLQPLLHSSDRLRQEYGEDLLQSLAVLRRRQTTAGLLSSLPRQILSSPAGATTSPSVNRVTAWTKAVDNRVAEIGAALGARDLRHGWLSGAGLWPCVTRVALLEEIRSDRDCSAFGENMRDALIELGIGITQLQRERRLLDAERRRLDRYKQGHQRQQHQQRLPEELSNPGHTNWNPRDHPDWLLLEIDADMLIRPDQVEVARATISPASGANSVLQMNMGRGKTSVIVPMTVAALADGHRLCRLIVPKALLGQAGQLMQARLGGLVGRRLCHVPFSRRTPIGTEAGGTLLDAYEELHRDTCLSRGLALTLQEHVLSFRLSGIQALADAEGKSEVVAGRMIQFQRWLDARSRDVLDESDFTLAVKTQLIYPSGPELAVDGHPHRWLTIETLLALIEGHARELRREAPDMIRLVERGTGFPIVHLLQSEAEDALMERVVTDVAAGRTAIFRPATDVDAKEMRRLICGPTATMADCRRACRKLHSPDAAAKQLLLIRGLVQHRVLALCLGRRWNVQYGLHPSRWPIAVPFEAKGVPSEQAEFGHPDVAITLTCLAFYYTGVTVQQLRASLGRILTADDPATEYDQWIGSCRTLREELRHWNLISVDDAGQVEELWRHLRSSKNVVDHYMNAFVFPAHAKQFTRKLQTSGWDIPLYPALHGGPDRALARATKETDGGKKSDTALTTGFSGTNDNRRLLPLTIHQSDLPGLQQTNAEVLTYLLQDRNSGYMVAVDDSGQALSEQDLLQGLCKLDIRVLIDAGAYILEMDNKALVTAWQAIDVKSEGALYFGHGNKLWVKYRHGREAPLVATPFADSLDDCLVYLDEAHTRGTDLRLPAGARGALTLGLGQTKDHTVQAAMRLRQLATTQSVMFVAPPEVDQSIRAFCGKDPREKVGSGDVVSWLLEQTCRANEQLRPLYNAQGIDFCRRTAASLRNPDRHARPDQARAYIESIVRPEHQSLEELYGTTATATANGSLSSPSPSSTSDTSTDSEEFESNILAGFARELRQAAAAHSYFTAASSSALEEVEQERQVEFQVEEVRNPQKPVSYEALRFPGLHRNIRLFALTGRLSGTDGYREAFEVIADTSVGKKFGIRNRRSAVHVSDEWLRTVQANAKSDPGLLRPVEWILLCPGSGIAIVVISEEAEILFHYLRRRASPGSSAPPVTHLITYSAPVTKNMAAFGRMAYYGYPALPQDYVPAPELVIDLGIFAGRLYFEYAEYDILRRHVGAGGGSSGRVRGNTGGGPEPLARNAIDFLAEWLAACRCGQDITHTPMGHLGQGLLLREDHPFFLEAADMASGQVAGRFGLGAGGAAGDDDDDSGSGSEGEGEHGEDWEGEEVGEEEEGEETAGEEADGVRGDGEDCGDDVDTLAAKMARVSFMTAD